MKTNSRVHPLLIALAAAAILPWLMGLAGLTTTSATEVVIFAIACMALNVLVGHTGLVSFGHGAWFGLAAYAAGLLQRNVFSGGFVLPILFGALMDLTGIRSSAFMLMYGVVWVSLIWMYWTEVRRTDVMGDKAQAFSLKG